MSDWAAQRPIMDSCTRELTLLSSHSEGESSSGNSDSDGASRRGTGRQIYALVADPMCSPYSKSLTALSIWVLFGFIGFGYMLEPDERLSWVDSVYLMCQIMTTVGYGDLAKPRENLGYLFYSIYVLSACMLVVQAVGTLIPKSSVDPAASSGSLVRRFSPRFVQFAKACLVWVAFVLSWTAFFTIFPGEERPVGQAMYMAVITLTTVGFGDYCPETDPGKVFASIWMLLGTAAFTMMLGKFGVYTYFLFNKMSVEKLDNHSLLRITETPQFQGVAQARAKVIEELLRGFEFDKYHEVSRAYAEKISRNDFLMFMILDMGLVDAGMVSTLSSHFDELDVTGEGYIDRDDLAKAIHDEALHEEMNTSMHSSSPPRRDP